MKIVNRKISDINPAKYNPRQITEKELSGLKESLKKFGFVEPLIINKRTNTLCGGHQRLKAAESLGMKEVPVFEVDLSISEEKALNVALNSPTISGKFDEKILSELLSEIKLEMPDLFSNMNMSTILPNIKVLDSEKLEEKLVSISFDYKIEVICGDEESQAYLTGELQDRGFKIRVLI